MSENIENDHNSTNINSSIKNLVFLDKLKKIIIEIIVIVFSVYISIWLSNRNEYQKQQIETKEFLSDLRTDLETDIKNINEEKLKLIESIQGTKSLLSLNSQQMKSLENIQMKVKFITRHNSEANYEGFKSTGKIGNIEDRKLRTNIISYYQQYLSTTSEMEKEINSEKKEVIEILGKNSFKTSTLKDPHLRTKLWFYSGTAESLMSAYEEDTKKAKEIIREIDIYIK